MLSAADRQMAEELVRDRALFPLPSSHFPIPPCCAYNKTSLICRFVLHCLSSLIAALIFAAHSQDDVKKMNQMMLYAKVVTIRDAQLNEKKVRSPESLPRVQIPLSSCNHPGSGFC